MHIRPEMPADVPAVRTVNEVAFETRQEADIVDALRGSPDPVISLVAEADGEVVGHILFSPVSLAGNSGHRLWASGPWRYCRPGSDGASVPPWCGRGWTRCRHEGCSAVVVLGHPEYYPRFGFVPASRYGIGSAYDVPDDVFMLIELVPGSLRGASDRVIYNELFNNA